MSKSIRDAAVGACATVIVLIAMAILTGAWSSKESTDDHKTDNTLIRTEIIGLRSDIQRIRDLICVDKPSAPQCRP